MVQGAAGSGKSEIGLHRIAFLLHPSNGLPLDQRPTPETTLFVGPSASFLESVSDLLPGLKVAANVQQTTFHDWVRTLHSTRLNIRASIWNDLLNKGRITRFNEQAEAFKGSMAMVDVLDRYARGLLQRVRSAGQRLPPLTVDFSAQNKVTLTLDWLRRRSRHIGFSAQNKVTLTRNDVQAALRGALTGAEDELRLNRRRGAFISRLTDTVLLMARQRGLSREQETEWRRRIETEYLAPWLDPLWPRMSFRREYVSLLSNTEEFLKLCRGAVDQEEAEALGDSVPQGLG